MVIGQGMAMVAGGLAFGAILGIAAGRIIAGLLFGVAASDPGVITGSVCVIIAATLAASWIYARQALRVDPQVALTAE
jgi:putative ABC transport system permease protein